MRIFKRFKDACERKIHSQFGFHASDVTWSKIVDYMFAPKDSSSLAVTRILFGLSMLLDIADERGGSTMDKRWGLPHTCHFPLIPYISAMPMPYMSLVYLGLWIGALGIMLGYKYRVTAPLYTTCYWYLFLIEKSYWNNHSYLFGLVALLLSCTEANCYWSVDVYLDPSKQKTQVPYWNYFVLKYQFFILYFIAGLKKGNAEWLAGYSVKNLSEHWVFTPFKLFLTPSQTNYLIVHWFVFAFDLTVAIWMMWSVTRNVAMILCALFHLMNSRLFSIGMFPWVCLAAMPLFYPFDWPKTVLKYFHVKIITFYTLGIDLLRADDCLCENCRERRQIIDRDEGIEDVMDDADGFNEFVQENAGQLKELREIELKDVDTLDNEGSVSVIEEHYQNDDGNSDTQIEGKSKRNTVLLILLYMFLQAFLPYSHFITKGYNNWTNGLYGYSWDMMVHTWDVHSLQVKVSDNEKNIGFFINPYAYTPNDRWTRHGDMVYQYARCLNNNIKTLTENNEKLAKMISSNLSINVEVWCSLNGRFFQRLYDPFVDLLKAEWHPFKETSYVMPLLDEAIDWRDEMDRIRTEINALSNYTDVVFFAEFPGYGHHQYVSTELKNVTLTILNGTVEYIQQKMDGKTYVMDKGDKIDVVPGMFHSVSNIGESPAYYMYTFYNITEAGLNNTGLIEGKPKLPIFMELNKQFNKMVTFFQLLLGYLWQIFYVNFNLLI